MRAAQRAECNHALEFALDQANRRRQPLFVYVFPDEIASKMPLRHGIFMFQGLKETRRRLSDRGIPLIVRPGPPVRELVSVSAGASLVVTDRGYLRVHRTLTGEAAEKLSCPLYRVESEAVVPVETVYQKEAWSAAVIRRRVLRILFAYLVPLEEREARIPETAGNTEGMDLFDPLAAASFFRFDESVAPVSGIRGGTDEGMKKLTRFIQEDLVRFDTERNNPGTPCASGLSPYLRFGHLSPLTAALSILVADSPGKERFLEELVIRRELALNFTCFNPLYDRYECLPSWARSTLSAHAGDKREYLYSREDLEAGRTHDPYWNAAQKELLVTGKMHGYMRMYWGKKILQWSTSPAEAFQRALYLNNRYALDGDTPNSYAGVAWCFGKHDRPWKERDIFGTVRYMNDKGLERKFDMKSYIQRVEKPEEG